MSSNYSTSSEKEKRAYVIMLVIAIILFIAVVTFLLISAIKTITTFAQLHNEGMTTPQVWEAIASNWWSFVKVTAHEDDKLVMNLSPFCITMIALGGTACLLLIPTFILMWRNRDE